MPWRKVNLENPSTQSSALQEHVEQMAASSVDTIIGDVRQLPRKRHARIRAPQAANWTLVKMAQRRGALIHSRGYIAHSACTQCQANNGLFTECVLLDGYMGGRCTNCFMNRNQQNDATACSLATEGERLERFMSTYTQIF